jgi:ParB family transcriptional regulator, chromosome partitioning protein
MNKPDLSKIGAVTAGKTRTTGISPFSELEISKVYPNPDQPRKQFDDIEELAATIKEHGLLQPITVVKKDNGYMIIAGERRYKAHLHNEAKAIKAYIVDVSEEQVEELTLIENIQRNDLTDFELAKHICKLWDSGRYEKKSDLATRIGKSDSYVSKSFNCLKLDSEIIDHIEQNKTPISIGVMDEIARVKDPVVQKEVYEKYSAGEITRDDIKDFKPKKLNEAFSFTNDVWSCSFFRNIGQDWVINRIKEHENYELRIKEVSTFTDYIQDDQSEISFVLNMTAKIKNAFKDKFDSFITKKSKLLELNAFYKITIKPTGKLFIASFIAPEHKEKEIEQPKTNHALERFEDADNDLVEQAKSFTKNFPRENKETIEEIQGSRTIINRIVGVGKSILNPNNEQTWLPIEDIGGFYLYNTGAGATKMFKKDVSYRLTIEEFNPIFQKFDAIDILNKENEELTAKIKELEKEIEELKQNISTEEVETTEEETTIKLLELNQNDVYIEYSNNEADHISYSKAKTLLKESKQEYIRYENSESEKACSFLNTLPKNITKWGIYLKKRHEI